MHYFLYQKRRKFWINAGVACVICCRRSMCNMLLLLEACCMWVKIFQLPWVG